MIPNQTLVDFPEFCNSGSKSAPGSAKYASGFQESDVLPAEWLNFFENKSSAGITALNDGVKSIEAELNNVVTAGGGTPDKDTNNQVLSAINYVIDEAIMDSVDDSLEKTSTKAVANSAVCAGLNMGAVCNTTKSTAAKTVTIDGFTLKAGSRVTVMFTYGNSGASPTLNVSSSGAKSIKVVKAGAKVAPINHTGYWRGAASTSSEMWQPYTTLELLYDGTDWVIVGNPDVETYVDANGNGYRVYADGAIEQWGGYINTSSGSNFNINIPLFISYSDTNYRFFRSNYMPNSGSSTSTNHGTLRGMLGYNTKTVSTVTVGVDGNSYLYGFDWRTSGY